jgi:hypothetical protein
MKSSTRERFVSSPFDDFGGFEKALSVSWGIHHKDPAAGHYHEFGRDCRGYVYLVQVESTAAPVTLDRPPSLWPSTVWKLGATGSGAARIRAHGGVVRGLIPTPQRQWLEQELLRLNTVPAIGRSLEWFPKRPDSWPMRFYLSRQQGRDALREVRRGLPPSLWRQPAPWLR